MKQIKFFSVPEEITQANAFLAANPPESVATVSKGEQCYIVVNYDDQTYPEAYKIEEIRGLMLSNTKEAMTAGISRDVAKLDLAKYQDDLASAQKELAEVEATVVPEVIGKEGKNKGKAIADYPAQAAKTKKATELTEKVNQLTDDITNIELAVTNMGVSIERFTKKNEVLQEVIDKLTAPQA